MKIQNEFSQNAKDYNTYNIIQTKVINKLINMISDKPKRLLDIGCGRGGIYKSITWPLKKFIGIDFAQGMIDLHPKEQNIELAVKDFNDQECFNTLKTYTIDRIISASALQWAIDLDKTLQKISTLNTPVTFAIFTSGTFKTLYETASLPPLLRSSDEVIKLSKRYYNADYQVLNYTLEFASVREMFQYMKRSGVGGGRNILSFKQMKMLMNDYPLEYLEFEIVLIHEKNILNRT